MLFGYGMISYVVDLILISAVFILLAEIWGLIGGRFK